MILIESKSEYKDFLDFMNDPSVKVLYKEETDKDIRYKFNTDEEIVVPKMFIDSSPYANDLIFGTDKTENIVSIEVQDNLLYLYKEKDGVISTEIRENEFWLLSPKAYPGFKRLSGYGYYKYIKNFKNRYEFEEERKIGFKRNYFSIYSPKESALIKYGLTYYKGMRIPEVSTLFFDIETSGLLHNHESKVFCISNTLRKNGQIIKKFFSVDDYGDDEIAMIKAWCKWVREVNPSIMCGHNIFGFDFPYLNFCYEMGTGNNLPLGRDDSEISFYSYTSKKRKDGSQEYEYTNIHIHGREIVDTMFVAFDYDIDREFPSYALKSIISFWGVEKEDRQHYDASKIAKNWYIPEEREKIKAYAKDDADDAMVLFDKMIPSQFYLTQSIPKNFQQIVNSATGSQINSFMIRAYMKDGHALPKASETYKFEGAISMGVPGVYTNVRKVDVASLYPSIIRQYKVCNKQKDPKMYFLEAMDYFTDERLKNKQLARETGDQNYTDLEQAQKIFINSGYGFLGAKGLLFNSPKDAEFITAKGREILLQGVEWAIGHTLERTIKQIVKEGKDDEHIKYHWVIGDKVGKGQGYTLVNVDTDSFSYTNGTAPTKEEFKTEISNLNSLYPEMINWENDGVYEKIIVIGAKNYVLKKHKEWLKPNEDLLTYKGSSITDQKKEPKLIEFIHKLIDEMLDKNREETLLDIYHEYCDIAYHLKDIKNWVTKKTVTKAILKPERANEQKPLDAINEAIKRKVIQKVQEGDKIWLYRAINGEKQKIAKGKPEFYADGRPKMEKNSIYRFPELWNNDHDRWHYVERVYKTVDIFKRILNIDKFINYSKKKNQHLLVDKY